MRHRGVFLTYTLTPTRMDRRAEPASLQCLDQTAHRRHNKVARLFFGLLTLAAIVTQLVLHRQHRFAVVNSFNSFTNVSNLFARVALIIGAVYLLRRREPTASNDIIQGSASSGRSIRSPNAHRTWRVRPADYDFSPGATAERDRLCAIMKRRVRCSAAAMI